jgi:hypothetical protein
MATVKISTQLAASPNAVWRAVKTPDAFRTVTRGLLTMPAIKRRHDTWREGETVVGWLFLFGVLPFSHHVLHVAQIDESAMILRTQERGGILRRWDHEIFVVPYGSSQSTYRDRIDIDAGILTPAVVLCANWFFRMRQRRWRTLAGKLTN